MSPAEKSRRELVADGCVSVKAAAKDTGFSPWVLYEAMRSRELPFVQVGRRQVIPRKALQAFLADRLVLR